MEDYYGCNKTLQAYELNSMQVDPQHRQNEPDLLKTRWFDYAGLLASQATYLYAHLYKVQTRIFCETYVDIRTADNVRAFAPNDIFESRDMTGMWLARRFADEHGMPYDFVMRFAQARAFERLWTRFPRPNQLYSEEFGIDVLAAWTETLTRKMMYSREERYHASKNVGSFFQKRHVGFVLKQVMARPAPRINILARMFHEDVLSPALVSAQFTVHEIDQAVEYAKRLAV